MHYRQPIYIFKIEIKFLKMLLIDMHLYEKRWFFYFNTQ